MLISHSYRVQSQSEKISVKDSNTDRQTVGIFVIKNLQSQSKKVKQNVLIKNFKRIDSFDLNNKNTSIYFTQTFLVCILEILIHFLYVMHINVTQEDQMVEQHKFLIFFLETLVLLF